MALDDIVLYKKRLVEEKRSQIETLSSELLPSSRSLIKALRQSRASFILEIKPASPSRGVIRRDANISSIALTYAVFADAISVLADEKFFGGSLANVEKVASIQEAPVLCKDVIVSSLQIEEARYYGADAVLLMLSVLDDDTYRACVHVAMRLKMDIITEVHSEEEMLRANRLEANIIGINNRNLKTLNIDMNTVIRLAPLARKEAVLIAESGIRSRKATKEIARLVDGFLVGTTLMSAERIDHAVRELLFGRVKICGITNGEDARNAYEAGAYYGGLNFSPQSPRFVTITEAREIIKTAPLVFGGVFVNLDIDTVCLTAKELKLSFVQIHGDEPDGYLEDLRQRLPEQVEIWRALRMTKSVTPKVPRGADRILLDSHSEKHYGGTGQVFDWKILDGFGKDFILAGGINGSNIEKADALEPFAIDIASGVEDENPRKKSKRKMEDLFSKLRVRGRS